MRRKGTTSRNRTLKNIFSEYNVQKNHYNKRLKTTFVLKTFKLKKEHIQHTVATRFGNTTKPKFRATQIANSTRTFMHAHLKVCLNFGMATH